VPWVQWVTLPAVPSSVLATCSARYPRRPDVGRIVCVPGRPLPLLPCRLPLELELERWRLWNLVKAPRMTLNPLRRPSILRLVLARLREPSTMAGLSVLVALFGLPPGVPELVAELVAAGAGLAAVLLPEATSSSSSSSAP